MLRSNTGPPSQPAPTRSSIHRHLGELSTWLKHIPPVAQKFLVRLSELRLVPPECLRPFLESRFDRLREYDSENEIGRALVDAKHLTEFQLERILAGQTHGLTLGGYRILDQLGVGGMGAVYLGEHCLMKRRVAIKVMPVDDDCHPSLLQRFYSEMRVQAELNHPNVVIAFDAGEAPAPGPNMPLLIYLVMELVEGGDLDRLVASQGARSIYQACDWARQAAEGLQAAHDRHVVHRDVKPSNLLLTKAEQVKIVDFGLARQFCSQLTDPQALLGSVEFMAPEQSHDPSGVGMAADTYGLGATLFWLLTGEPPYPFMSNVGAALRALQRDPPRKLCDLRPDAPKELEILIEQMLSRDPQKRPAPLLAVSRVLSRFGGSTAAPLSRRPLSAVDFGSIAPEMSEVLTEPCRSRALVVDDDEAYCHSLREVIAEMGCECEETSDLALAMERVEQTDFDLILLNLSLPGLDVEKTCQVLRERASQEHLKILGVSKTRASAQGTTTLAVVDDCYSKSPEMRGVTAKVDLLLRVKASEDRIAQLSKELEEHKQKIEQSVQARDRDRRQAHDALLFALAKMVELNDGETAGHVRRLQRYVRTLAQHAARGSHPLWSGLIDDGFLSQMERCLPLHDIGKIGLPDEILLEPGTLDAREHVLMESHVVIGDRILESLGAEHGGSMDFLRTARAIVRHHHERFDGKGYPDKLVGDEIPPAARLTYVADLYDNLRRATIHKPSMTHDKAVHVMLGLSAPEMDPALLDAFEVCHPDFERIYREVGD